MGKPLRVMKSCRNPALRASGKGNVRVNNLDRQAHKLPPRPLPPPLISTAVLSTCDVPLHCIMHCWQNSPQPSRILHMGQYHSPVTIPRRLLVSSSSQSLSCIHCVNFPAWPGLQPAARASCLVRNVAGIRCVFAIDEGFGDLASVVVPVLT